MPAHSQPTAPATADDMLATVQAALALWYGEHRRDLPWRSPDRTAWGVLVSEVMLQQTPVVRVLPRWLEWMSRWPDPADLAVAPTADVLRAWDRLGYPRRALRLQECARTIVAEHGGQVPQTEAELRALPGIGEYTAAAVLAFAYGQRATVLDTNVRRVLARVFDGTAQPPVHLSAAERSRAASLVPVTAHDAATWAAATMELGALVCTARNPSCEACPVSAVCTWTTAGRPPDEHAHRRRSQTWHGTDRQVRGRIMALLRDAGTVSRSVVLARVPGSGSQVDRCLAGLLADGLAVEVTEGPAPTEVPEPDRPAPELGYRLP